MVPCQVRPEQIRNPGNGTRCRVQWIRHPVLYIFDPYSAQNRRAVLESDLLLFQPLKTEPRLLLKMRFGKLKLL